MKGMWIVAYATVRLSCSPRIAPGPEHLASAEGQGAFKTEAPG